MPFVQLISSHSNLFVIVPASPIPRAPFTSLMTTIARLHHSFRLSISASSYLVSPLPPSFFFPSVTPVQFIFTFSHLFRRIGYLSLD